MAPVLSFGGIDDVTSLIPQKPITNIFPVNSLEVPQHDGIFTNGSAIDTHVRVFG